MAIKEKPVEKQAESKVRESTILWPDLPKMVCRAVGRRKEASARVRLYKMDKDSKSTQKDLINGKLVKQWFSLKTLQDKATRPYEIAGLEGKFFFTAIVEGGGITGQADAVALGLSRCLAKEGDEIRALLSKAGLMRRDPREVERKHIFHYKARRAPQWSKR